LVRCTPAISVSIVTERRNEPPGEGLVYWKGEERFMAKPSLGGAPPGWGSLGCNPILLCRNGFYSYVCILLLNFPSSRHGPIAKEPIAETPHTICTFCSCLLMGTSNLGCRHMRPGTHGDGSWKRGHMNLYIQCGALNHGFEFRMPPESHNWLL
jgi:hypothetical protein